MNEGDVRLYSGDGNPWDTPGTDDLTMWVCWYSNKNNGLTSGAKHGTNESRWHILKPGELFACLCGASVHFGEVVVRSAGVPEGPVIDPRRGWSPIDREPCTRCVAIRRRKRAETAGEARHGGE